MIRGIVAIDEKRGMAGDHGIPWDIPGDKKYFVDSLQSGLVLMGYNTYLEVKRPFGGHTNYVATTKKEKLRNGFVSVTNVSDFLSSAEDDVWNIGGANLLASTIQLLDKLYYYSTRG